MDLKIAEGKNDFYFLFLRPFVNLVTAKMYSCARAFVSVKERKIERKKGIKKERKKEEKKEREKDRKDIA